jgi:hypothetical protein
MKYDVYNYTLLKKRNGLNNMMHVLWKMENCMRLRLLSCDRIAFSLNMIQVADNAPPSLRLVSLRLIQ